MGLSFLQLKVLLFLSWCTTQDAIEPNLGNHRRDLQETSVTVSIRTDLFPEEISWLLFDSVDGSLIRQVTAGTYVDPETTNTTILSVTHGREYTLQLMDTGLNGICCANGMGEVFVYLGSEPQSANLIGYSRGSYRDQTFVTFEASENGTAVFAPSTTPSFAPTVTSAPSSLPSMIPSSSQSPTVTGAPSVTRFPVMVTVAILTDRFPQEIGWKLLDKDGTMLEERPIGSYAVAGALQLATVLLLGGDRYSLLLEDAAGDGICCAHGVGEARVYLGFPEASPLAYSNGEYLFSTTLGFVASMEGIIAAPPTIEIAPTMAPVAPITEAPIAPSEKIPLEDLGFAGCSSLAPCEACQGDCDFDDDCVGDLRCFQRFSSGPIPPECFDSGAFLLGSIDFCSSTGPPTPTPPTPGPADPSLAALEFLGGSGCSPSEPCDNCQGDCDVDDDCVGVLVCTERFGTSSPIPPGCRDDGSFDISDWDFCGKAIVPTPPPTSPIAPICPSAMALEWLGSSGCSSSAPCGKCQGDCDSDSQCAGNLICTERNSSTDPIPEGCVFAGGFELDDWDFCGEPFAIGPTSSPPLQFLGSSGCSSTSPCEVCQGDCDSDSECGPGLTCFVRDDFSAPFPPGCTYFGDFQIEDWDFCIIDPSASPLPPTPTPVTPAPSICPEIPPTGCAVCGEGFCVGNPTATIVAPDLPSVDCGFLEFAGLVGIIEPTECPTLPPLITDACECQSGIPPSPAPKTVAPATTAPNTAAPVTSTPILGAPIV